MEITLLPKADIDIQSFIDGIFCDQAHALIGNKPNHFCFTAKDSGKILGAAKGHSYGTNLYLSQLVIEESSQGKGIGTALLEKAMLLAIDRNCKKIWVDTMSYQAPDFYKRLGFTEHSRIKNYRDEHDRIFLVRDVPSPCCN